MSAKLGRNQLGVLRALRDHKGYRHGGGWYWSSESQTERILSSLVRRGLVTVTEEDVDSVAGTFHALKTWRLTAAGKAALGVPTLTLLHNDDEGRVTP